MAFQLQLIYTHKQCMDGFELPFSVVTCSSSLTLEGVRRMLEKDMGLETFALDAHKRFIKQCLQEVMLQNPEIPFQ